MVNGAGGASPARPAKRYTILHPLVLSFFSPAVYRDVGLRWRGVGISYLLLLELVAWIPVAVKIHVGLGSFLEGPARGLVAQIPNITVTKGEVRTDGQEPVEIKEPGSGETVLIIDTTGRFTSLDGTPARALLTRTKLFLRQGPSKVESYDLAGIDGLSINRAGIEAWLGRIRRWTAIVLYPLAVGFAWAYRVVQALLYGAIGLLFRDPSGTRLGYAALLRLASVAVTPVVLLDTALALAAVSIPLWGLLCLGIALGYLFFGVRACAGPDEAPRTAPGLP